MQFLIASYVFQRPPAIIRHSTHQYIWIIIKCDTFAIVMFLVSLLQKWLWCRVFYVLFSTYCTLLCFTYYSQRTALYYVLHTLHILPGDEGLSPQHIGKNKLYWWSVCAYVGFINKFYWWSVCAYVGFINKRSHFRHSLLITSGKTNRQTCRT